MLLKKQEIADRLLAFYFRDVSPFDFERWLYGADELEALIGKEEYLELLAVNYRRSCDIEQARLLARELYERIEGRSVEYGKARAVAEKIATEQVDLAEGCRALAALRLGGFSLIPASFAGYATELDTPEHVKFYRERVIRDAVALVNTLDHRRE